MLIEYVGDQEVFILPRHGVDYTWKAQEKYGGAKVVDVTNPAVQHELLSSRDYQGNCRFQRYALAALIDPEFIRQVTRNPEAVRYIQDHPAEFQMSAESVQFEAQQMPVEQLRVWAAEIGLKIHSLEHKHNVVEVITNHYRKTRIVEMPVVEKAPIQKNKGGRPKKAVAA